MTDAADSMILSRVKIVSACIGLPSQAASEVPYAADASDDSAEDENVEGRGWLNGQSRLQAA